MIRACFSTDDARPQAFILIRHWLSPRSVNGNFWFEIMKRKYRPSDRKAEIEDSAVFFFKLSEHSFLLIVIAIKISAFTEQWSFVYTLSAVMTWRGLSQFALKICLFYKYYSTNPSFSIWNVHKYDCAHFIYAQSILCYHHQWHLCIVYYAGYVPIIFPMDWTCMKPMLWISHILNGFKRLK